MREREFAYVEESVCEYEVECERLCEVVYVRERMCECVSVCVCVQAPPPHQSHPPLSSLDVPL